MLKPHFHRLIIFIYFSLQSLVLAVEWPNCKEYERKIAEKIKGASFKDRDAVVDIVENEIKDLKSIFSDELNELYAESMVVIDDKMMEYPDRISKDPANPANRYMRELPLGIRNMNGVTPADMGDIRLAIKRRDLEWFKEWQTEDKQLYLKNMTETVEELRTRLNQTYKDCEDEKSVTELREFISKFCDIKTAALWYIIGRADQKIKKNLSEEKFAADNRMVMQISVQVPIAYLNSVLKFVGDKVKVPVDAPDDAPKLWQAEGMKITAASMRKVEARVKTELQTIRDDLARRVNEAKSHPNETFKVLFQNFENEIVECHRQMDETIVMHFLGPKLMDRKCDSNGMNTLDGIENCLLLNARTVAHLMAIYTESVMMSAMALNYQLEKINRMPNCIDYETKIKGAPFEETDRETVLGIIDYEMKTLQYYFHKELDRLNARHGNGNIDELETYYSNITRICSNTYTDISGLWDQYKEYKARELRQYAVPFCTDTTLFLWIEIAEADQVIKKMSGAPNIIEPKVKIVVPADLEAKLQTALNAVNAASAADKSQLWHREGIKIGKASMEAEKIRVKAELNTLRDKLARRVKSTESHPNEMVNLFFEKFEKKIEECRIKMNVIINGRFDRTDLYTHKCTNMDEMPGFLNCLKINVDHVASGMTFYAEAVVKLAKVLNYQLELINH